MTLSCASSTSNCASRLGPPGVNPYKRPESVLVMVYSRGGRVLLLRRADHPEFWQSVTGSMKWEESLPRRTAERELKEETGLEAGTDIQDLGLTFRYEILPQWRYRYAPEVAENLEHVFALELSAEVDVTLNPAEHTGYAWLSVQEALIKATSWSNRDVIRQVLDPAGP